MFIVSNVWSCNAKTSSDQASKDKDRECMPWSLKGHSVIANAWRQNWARPTAALHAKCEDQSYGAPTIFAQILVKNIIFDLWLFHGLEKVMFQEFQLHMVIFQFDIYPMVALQNHQTKSKTRTDDWISISSKELPRLRTKNPSNSKGTKLDDFNGKKSSFPCTREVLPAYPMRIAKDFMPCIWRCSWKTLTWSEVSPSNLTKNGFNFWRFGQLSSLQIWPQALCLFMFEFFVAFLHNWERWNRKKRNHENGIQP